VLCSVQCGQWRSALAHQQLMNTTRMYSLLLFLIHLFHHPTFHLVKSHHLLLQQDLHQHHSLNNSHHSLWHNLLRPLGHVSSTGCQSHTLTGENMPMDQSGMTTPPCAYKVKVAWNPFYVFFAPDLHHNGEVIYLPTYITLKLYIVF